MTTLLPLLFISRAFALDHELTAEFGYVTNQDPAFDLFSDRNVLGAQGIRGVAALSEHVGVVASWQHSGRGATVNPGYDYELSYYDDSDSAPGGYNTAYQSAFRSDQFALGPIADWELFDGTLAPYAHADMVLQRGTAYMASGAEHYPNRVEVENTSMNAGISAMAGVSVNVPVVAGFELTGHLEVGTTRYFGPLRFEDFGEMQPGGFTLRTGVGVRY